MNNLCHPSKLREYCRRGHGKNIRVYGRDRGMQNAFFSTTRLWMLELRLSGQGLLKIGLFSLPSWSREGFTKPSPFEEHFLCHAS